TLSQSGKQSNDGMDISLLIVDKQNSSIQFAGAYNSIYLIRENELKEFKADRMPIGKYHRENVAFSSQSFDYKEGDTVYMLSDGFPDQFSSSLNKKYTRKQFKDFILKHNSESMQEQESLLKNEFDNWREEEKQLDDVLVIGARF
ncbi:MAG: serine/threonine-protein phosphatase, partial [Bacteroidales bacterium]|nr:serine/threonine-protein phosphatase [Bacteroidales bacterium]